MPPENSQALRYGSSCNSKPIINGSKPACEGLRISSKLTKQNKNGEVALQHDHAAAGSFLIGKLHGSWLNI